jgi:hypothetical protein
MALGRLGSEVDDLPTPLDGFSAGASSTPLMRNLPAAMLLMRTVVGSTAIIAR